MDLVIPLRHLIDYSVVSYILRKGTEKSRSSRSLLRMTVGATLFKAMCYSFHRKYNEIHCRGINHSVMKSRVAR